MLDTLNTILTNVRASRRKVWFKVNGEHLQDADDGIFLMQDIMSGNREIAYINTSVGEFLPIIEIDIILM